jgi:ribosomal protein L7/L12
MKITYTLAEAQSALAAKLNSISDLNASHTFYAEDVRIDFHTTPALTTDAVAAQLLTIMKEARCDVPNKINLIKAVRTLAPFGLKEAKDLVEQIFPPSY